jgi:hypothetical protein
MSLYKSPDDQAQELTAPLAPLLRQPKGQLVAVKVISLPAELGQALLGAVTAGLGAFVAGLTVTTASNDTALKEAGIAAGITGGLFFVNSLKGWYAQRYGTTPQ